MTQLWVAMCMYLLLAYLKFVMRLRWSLHQMLQVLQLNMFERRSLQDLFTTPSLPAPSGPLWLPIVAGVVLKMESPQMRVGSGGASSMPPQQRNSIEINAPGEWKP